jgi:aspergillopepsin I
MLIRTPAPPILFEFPDFTQPPNPAHPSHVHLRFKMLYTATVLALALAAQAMPTERTTSSSFSIPAVHNTNHVRNGTAAMLKAYKKFNLQPSTSQALSESFWNELSRSRKRQDGVVTASPDPDNVEYLVPVTIGGQTLNLDFDSGSADLYVYPDLSNIL